MEICLNHLTLQKYILKIKTTHVNEHITLHCHILDIHNEFDYEHYQNRKYTCLLTVLLRVEFWDYKKLCCVHYFHLCIAACYYELRKSTRFLHPQSNPKFLADIWLDQAHLSNVSCMVPG